MVSQSLLYVVVTQKVAQTRRRASRAQLLALPAAVIELSRRVYRRRHGHGRRKGEATATCRAALDTAAPARLSLRV